MCVPRVRVSLGHFLQQFWCCSVGSILHSPICTHQQSAHCRELSFLRSGCHTPRALLEEEEEEGTMQAAKHMPHGHSPSPDLVRLCLANP